MNTDFLLITSTSFKSQLLFVSLMLVSILVLPLLAISLLGQNTIKFLATSSVPEAIDRSTQGLYQGPTPYNDTYAWGNCTYWVFLLRSNAGAPIPTTWGNASTWAINANLDGYIVNQTPTPGSIMQISNVDNGLGHVAYVESVNSTTGTWTISEMNVKGLDIVDTQTFSTQSAKLYEFIHDKI